MGVDAGRFKCKDGTVVSVSRHQCPEWAQRFPGGEGWSAYPHTWEHTYEAVSGGNGITLTPAYWQWMWNPLINRYEAIYALSEVGGGYINLAANLDKGWSSKYHVPKDSAIMPKVEGITSAYNIHKIMLDASGNPIRKNGSTRIEALRLKDGPPDPNLVNPQTTPWLFVQFRSIDRDGNIGYAPKGIKGCYFPILVKEQAWVKDEYIEAFLDEYPTAAAPPPEEPMPERTAGTAIDISAFQGPIDWKNLTRVDLVIMRATYGFGGATEDAWFQEYWRQAWYWSYHRQAYSWHYPNLSPESQHNVFVDVMDRAGGLKPEDGAPDLDFEDLRSVPIQEALDSLEQRLLMTDLAFNCITGVYSRASLLSQATKNQLEFLRGRPLWLAGYPFAKTTPIPIDYLPPDQIPAGYLTFDLGWEKWQWAETLPYNGLPVGLVGGATYSGKGDADITRGTFEAYWKRTGRTLRTDPRFVYRRKLHSLMAVTFPNSIGERYAKHPFLDRRA